MIVGLSSHTGIARYTSAKLGGRVFLGEDDPDLRNLMSESLRRANFAVLNARHGGELLYMLSAVSRGVLPCPDVVVMDVRMPSYSGLDLLRAMRMAEWKVPVVLMTGFGDDLMHERAKQYGAHVLLDKPVRAEKLIEAVREAVVLQQ